MLFLLPVQYQTPLFELMFNCQIELKSSKFGRCMKGEEFSTMSLCFTSPYLWVIPNGYCKVEII